MSEEKIEEINNEEEKSFKEELKVEPEKTNTQKELEETTDRLKRVMAEFENVDQENLSV